MTDRSTFRFRVPRLRPSVPPPRTTVATTRTPARKSPARPQPQPSPPQPAPPQPQEPIASPPTSPSPSLQPAGKSPTPLPQEPIALPPPPPSIQPQAPPLAQEPPKSPPPSIQPQGTSTAPPPPPNSPVRPPRQDEPPSMEIPPPTQTTLPSSPSQPPKVKMPTEITANPESMTSHPHDKIPLPKSPESNPLNHLSNARITLAGDNKGTSMHIGSTTKREKSIHISRKYKVNPDENTDTMTEDEEEKDDENEEKSSYINCNIQGINNSMVLNCSITERSPGVHLGSCDHDNVMKLKRKYVKSTDLNKVNTKKDTIRRRCLRGLFLESSDDSDLNDPQKPRRHGCRYIDGDKSNKNHQMDVV